MHTQCLGDRHSHTHTDRQSAEPFCNMNTLLYTSHTNNTYIHRLSFSTKTRTLVYKHVPPPLPTSSTGIAYTHVHTHMCIHTHMHETPFCQSRLVVLNTHIYVHIELFTLLRRFHLHVCVSECIHVYICMHT